MGENKAPPESQQAMYFQSTQLVYPIRIPPTIVLTVEEYQKDKVVEKDGLEKLDAIEDWTRAINGTSLYDPVKASKMCLVPHVVIPKRFRVLEFVKYTGTQCLITHIKAYYNKITEVVHDEKLLIHFFQDNLSDIALTWYIRLDNTKVKRWKDLIDAFIRQYKFNMGTTPDRSSL